MASFGENLKREREMRGVPLREISDSTKINLHFLQALEDEEFDKLPGGVFNRGFIRAYSRHLGLDEQKLLGEYDLVLGRKEPFETPRMPVAPPPPPLEATSSQAPLLAAAIAVVMLVIGYALYRYSDQPIIAETPSESVATPLEQIPAAGESPGEAGPQPVPAPSPPVQETPRQAAAQPAKTTPAPPPRTPTPTPTPAASQASAETPADSTPSPAPAPEGPEQAAAEPEETAPTDSQEASSAPAPEPAATEGESTDNANAAAETTAPGPSAPSASESLVLRVVTTEPAWVSIEADGKTVVQRTLEADEVRTFRAKEFFQVRTGNAGGLILTLNGETLAPLGNGPGQVRSIRLTRENLPSGNP